jgi:hypothetical protein
VQTLNTNKLKKECLIAVAIFFALIGLLDRNALALNTYVYYGIVALSGLVTCWALYRYFTYFELATAEIQLGNLSKQLKNPIMIADLKHEIRFVNDSFGRLPLSAQLAKYHSLPDLMTSFDTNLDPTAKLKQIAQSKQTLEALTGKMKTRIQWGGDSFEWTIAPLLSSTGKRWGTIIECLVGNAAFSNERNPEFDLAKSREGRSKNTELPLMHILDQVAVPFVFVDKQEKIAYTNLSFKMLLQQHQHFIQKICPEFNLEEPTMNSLKHFLRLLRKVEVSFSDLLSQRMVPLTLSNEKYHMCLQPLWDAGNYKYGTMILLQEAVESENEVLSSTLFSEKEIISQAFAQSHHAFAILDTNFQIQQINKGLIGWLKNIDETLSDVNEKWISENFVSIVQTLSADLSERLLTALRNNQPTRFVAQHGEIVCDWAVTPLIVDQNLLGYMLEIIHPSRQETKGLEEGWQRGLKKRAVIEKELLQFTKGLSKLNLYQKETETTLNELKPEDYQHPLLKNASKIVQKMGLGIRKLYDEVNYLKNSNVVAMAQRPYDLPMVEELDQRQFDQIIMTLDENKRKAEDVLFEDFQMEQK